jgi:hypothetical protein
MVEAISASGPRCVVTTSSIVLNLDCVMHSSITMFVFVVSCFSRLLLHLFQPLQPRPRIRQSLGKPRLLRQSGRLFVFLPRFPDLAFHLEELAQVMCRDRASHIAFLIPLRRHDGSSLCQCSRRPLSRLFYEECARRGIRDGEVSGCGGHGDGIGGRGGCLLDKAGRDIVHQDDAVTGVWRTQL